MACPAIPGVAWRSASHGRQQADRHEFRGDEHGDAKRHGADGAPGSALSDAESSVIAFTVASSESVCMHAIEDLRSD